MPIIPKEVLPIPRCIGSHECHSVRLHVECGPVNTPDSAGAHGLCGELLEFTFSFLPLPIGSYLSDGVGYLLGCLKRDRERGSAFKALGQMVYVLKDRMDLEPVLNIVKVNLPTGKEHLSK